MQNRDKYNFRKLTRRKLIESENGLDFIAWDEIPQTSGEVSSLAKFVYSQLESWLDQFNDGLVYVENEFEETGNLFLVDKYGDNPIVEFYFGGKVSELERGKNAWAFKVDFIGTDGPQIYNLYDMAIRDIAEEIMQSIEPR